jgi:hypothetical protein
MTWRGVWDGEWDGVWEGGGDPNAASGGTSFGFTLTGTLTATGVAPPVTEEVTPGYPGGDRRRRTYRLRVGRRWVEVDPLDSESLRRAYALAEDAAQEAAERRVVAPRRSAARVVAAVPQRAATVDYAGLAADARRVSEQVRAVYAEALQRELIARLMRERIERDDEDDIELLLMV